jgi:hypothetical protein
MNKAHNDFTKNRIRDFITIIGIAAHIVEKNKAEHIVRLFVMA